jgi:transposase
MLLAKFENISVRTIQNRLRLAREKGLLAQPGSGKRFN